MKILDIWNANNFIFIQYKHFINDATEVKFLYNTMNTAHVPVLFVSSG